MFHFKKGASLLMAGVTAFGCVAPALASDIWGGSYTHNDMEGSDSNVDVNVLVQNRTLPMIFSAYVPATVKIAVSRDNQVITPGNLRIINGVDTLPIGVWDVKTKPVNGWTCLDWKTDFQDRAMTDQKKFAMKLNGNDLRYEAKALPWEIDAGGELPLDLEAKIAYQMNARDMEEIMTVSFTMDWMDVVYPTYGNPHAKGTAINKSRLDSLAKSKTGTLSFSRELYNEAKHGPAVDISEAQDKSAMCVVMGQNVIVYGDGGVKAPVNSSNLFNGYAASTLDLRNLDTSDVTNMSYMFYNTSATKLDLSRLDTSKVTDMSYMFSYVNASTLDLTYLDTSNVTNMYAMFYVSKTPSLDVSMLDTRKVTNMAYMFASSYAKTINLSNLDTENVTNMTCMFDASQVTTLDLSSFYTSNVTTMYEMFEGAQVTTLDLSSFDMSNVSDTRYMFNASYLTKIYCRSDYDRSKMVNSSYRQPSSSYFVVGHP